MTLLLFALAQVPSWAALLILGRGIEALMRQAPHLSQAEGGLDRPPTSVTVIVPAYNEALNVRPCLEAILASQLNLGQQLRVILADDGSSDETLAQAQALAQTNDRLTVLAVPPRPQGETWVGKNWACAQATPLADSEWILFIDADVRLGERAIARALREAQAQNCDLLSCAPRIVCGCLAEWLVQPVLLVILALGSDFEPVNDPLRDKAFAAGPFMLFRRSAYNTIGGHRALADNVVEDLALARAIKQAGLKLRYLLALEDVSVRMYANWAALWEGWTKNWFLGCGGSIPLTLMSAAAIFLAFAAPWLSLLVALLWRSPLAMLLATTTLLAHLWLRWRSAYHFQVGQRYWWLGGIGGLLATAIILASIVKAKTGWGWTWRGRSLQPVRAEGT
jgi:glycosyltransferase involved in cell wall biosynthesis